MQSIAAAVGAAAGGAGHRPIASALDRPASTVPGWLRAARAAAPLLVHLAAGVQHLLYGPSGPERLALIPPAVREPLAAAMTELITAAQGCQEMLAAVTGQAPGIAECLNPAAAGRLVYPARGPARCAHDPASCRPAPRTALSGQETRPPRRSPVQR